MKGAECGKDGGEEEYIQSFGRKTGSNEIVLGCGGGGWKVTTWKK
jgi:hypothetical protein